MTKLKIISLASVAIAGVAASIIIQHNSQDRFGERDALLRQQDEQLAALTAEHDRLSDLVTHVNGATPVDHTAELARLRREAEVLKKQTNDLGRPLEINRQFGPSLLAASPVSSPPSLEVKMRHMTEARDAGMIFREYAHDHQNQFPSSLDQIATYLTKENKSFSESDHFDILYQGSLDNLNGLPLGSVAVIRSHQVWQGEDGKMTRIYGFADSHAQVVESDDNFQSWEAKHVISPPTSGQ